MDEQNPDGRSSGTGRKILIALLALLLVGSIGLYVSGVSLKSLPFGLSTQEGDKVGVTKAVTGQLKRQPKDSLEFLDAKVNSDLFNEDTVMTGPDDHATDELFDGSILELDPGSLIRLSFENAQGVGGIERHVLVDIVAGNVKGDMSRPKLVVRRGGKPVVRTTPTVPIAAPSGTPAALPTPAITPTSTPELSPTPSPSPSPEPSPSPTALMPNSVKITEPNQGQIFTVPAGSKPPLKRALVFESLQDPSATVMMVLKNAAGKELLRKTVTANKGRGGLLATFERPGDYSVEVRNPDGTKIGRGVRAPFTVAAEYDRIEVLPPTVGGEPIDSNKFTGKRLRDFDVALHWKPLEGIDKYRVVVQNKAGQKSFDEVVTGTNYPLAKGKISTDAVTYQIRVERPNGYIATSKKESFLFSFQSPAQTLPKDGEAISLAGPEAAKQKGILFSWQRTTFTEGYEFEIALDPQFKNIIKTVKIKQQDNFLIFKNLKARDYWWRVRSTTGDLKSPPGTGFKITVTP